MSALADRAITGPAPADPSVVGPEEVDPAAAVRRRIYSLLPPECLRKPEPSAAGRRGAGACRSDSRGPGGNRSGYRTTGGGDSATVVHHPTPLAAHVQCAAHRRRASCPLVPATTTVHRAAAAVASSEGEREEVRERGEERKG